MRRLVADHVTDTDSADQLDLWLAGRDDVIERREQDERLALIEATGGKVHRG